MSKQQHWKECRLQSTPFLEEDEEEKEEEEEEGEHLFSSGIFHIRRAAVLQCNAARLCVTTKMRNQVLKPTAWQLRGCNIY